MKKKLQHITTGIVVLVIALTGLYWMALTTFLLYLIFLVFRSELALFAWIRKRRFVSSIFTIIGIFLLAISIRIFFIEIFSIPSSSMENTLYPGDKVLVSKLNYGPAMPQSPFEIPWINLIWYLSVDKSTPFDSIYWNHKRLNGFSSLKNGDVVVFIHPLWGQRDNFFIKRCMGLPGDTLQIINGVVLANQKALHMPESVKQPYVVKVRHLSAFKNDSSHWVNKELKWTIDHYGPMIIPQKGMNIPLNALNYKIYHQTIEQLEKVNIEEKQGIYYINGKPSITYVFRKNYCFMIGDNRHNSADSRIWGLVPEENIVGKAVIILFSNNTNGIQWPRFFKLIK